MQSVHVLKQKFETQLYDPKNTPDTIHIQPKNYEII